MATPSSRLWSLAVLGVAACTFPTDGVPLQGNAVDAGVDSNGGGDGCVPTGEPCDGPDADLCLDDMMACSAAGSPVCGDGSGDDDAELCNGPGFDEDCDGNVDEGFAVAAPCDGPDGDACAEGTSACAADGLGVVCDDATGDLVEVCDGDDDDCDVLIDETFDLVGDEANCGTCGNTCSNALGTTTCTSSACVPTCNNGAADCNGVPDDGCELVDTNPACATVSAMPDVQINGDDAAGSTATVTGTTERFLRLRIRELHSGGTPTVDRDPTARLVLTSGTGTDFDLFVYCTASCNSVPRSAGNDILEIGNADTPGSSTFDVIVEIRYDPTTPSTTCAAWSLAITGDAGTVDSNCPG